MAAVPALLSGGIPRLVDDLAYGAGLWKGVLAEREPGPLRPRFTSWPGTSARRLSSGSAGGASRRSRRAGYDAGTVAP